jgi:uncharacterized protein YbbC (DUF1343 family)
MLSGLDCLCRQSFAPLRGLSVGLVTHPAAVDCRLRSAMELFAAAPQVRLAALFGPEHGFFGNAQDLIAVTGDGSFGGIRCHSLYGSDVASLKPTPAHLAGLDALVIDLQDVGSRYYTFQATMLFCIEAAFEQKLRVVVLDRPNPLGGDVVEGPTIQPGYESFVGIHPVAIRHGMTVGELARFYVAERNLAGDLLIIPCEGWRRDMMFDETGLPWVMPSPNMPTLDTALVYPGQCLLEGTNASEGRGTTRPFEICGMPHLDAAALAERLRNENLPGVALRPMWFTPTFQKFTGTLCGGVQLHVLDRRKFQPVRTGLAVVAAMRDLAAQRFDWRRDPYEFVADRLAIDLLLGGPRERLALEGGASLADMTAVWENEEAEFRRRREPHLIYG